MRLLELDAFTGNVPQELWIRVTVRVLPLFEPHREGGNVDAGLEEHLVGDVGHLEFRVDEFPSRALEQNQDVGVAVGAMGASSPGSVEDCARGVELPDDAAQK